MAPKKLRPHATKARFAAAVDHLVPDSAVDAVASAIAQVVSIATAIGENELTATLFDAKRALDGGAITQAQFHAKALAFAKHGPRFAIDDDSSDDKPADEKPADASVYTKMLATFAQQTRYTVIPAARDLDVQHKRLQAFIGTTTKQSLIKKFVDRAEKGLVPIEECMMALYTLFGGETDRIFSGIMMAHFTGVERVRMHNLWLLYAQEDHVRDNLIETYGAVILVMPFPLFPFTDGTGAATADSAKINETLKTINMTMLQECSKHFAVASDAADGIAVTGGAPRVAMPIPGCFKRCVVGDNADIGSIIRGGEYIAPVLTGHDGTMAVDLSEVETAFVNLWKKQASASKQLTALKKRFKSLEQQLIGAAIYRGKGAAHHKVPRGGGADKEGAAKLIGDGLMSANEIRALFNSTSSADF